MLASILAVPPAFLAHEGASGQPQNAPLPLTPSCGEPAKATVSQTAGPFYTPRAPLKRDLATDVTGGRPITLAGFVVDTSCKPLAGAMVEIWHADDNGEYDNDGFRLRGHQVSDEAGRWGFSTIVTRQYSGRTAHYHFRVRRPGGRVLTTQLYFPDHPRNRSDGLFDPRLLMRMSTEGGRQVGRFDFVV